MLSCGCMQKFRLVGTCWCKATWSAAKAWGSTVPRQWDRSSCPFQLGEEVWRGGCCLLAESLIIFSEYWHYNRTPKSVWVVAVLFINHRHSGHVRSHFQFYNQLSGIRPLSVSTYSVWCSFDETWHNICCVSCHCWKDFQGHASKVS